MPPVAAWLSLVTVMLLPVAANGQDAPPKVADPGGQVARFMQADLNPVLRSAPKPSAMPKDLSLQLVDYIDCTAAPDGLHPRLGDGRGGVRKTAIGAYRETGASAHSWFAYRFRVAAPGKAHVLVMEFPDDADRMTALAVAQPPSGDADKPAARVEFGYRTGDLLPVSGKMVTRWTVFYPTGSEPPAMVVANWHARNPAALARVWVYLVTGNDLPAAKSRDKRFYRSAGLYVGDARMLHTSFGGRADNLIRTLNYLGMNEAAIDVFRGTRAAYPSARFSTEDTFVPEVLKAFEAASKRLIAVFDPDCSVGTFNLPGFADNAANINRADVHKAWFGFVSADFLKPFGNHPGLGGVMFGGPRGSAAWDLKNADGQTTIVTVVASNVARQYKTLRIYQNFGPGTPAANYFDDRGSPWQSLGRWEVGRQSMDECLADHVLNHWRRYGLIEESLIAPENVVTLRQCNRDDASAVRFGRHPRARYWLYDAVAHSPAVTARSGGGKLSGLIVHGRRIPRMLLLRRGAFWWDWAEMSPVITPGGSGFLAPAARAVAAGLEPCTLWLAADGPPVALHEEEVRHWVTTFRNLPFRSFAPLEGTRQYPVAVRTYELGANRYVVMVNVSPVPAMVTLTLNKEAVIVPFGRPVKGKHKTVRFALAADELAAFAVPVAVTIENTSQTTDAAEAALATRLERFAADLQAARQAGGAMPPRYERVVKDARDALRRKDLAAADALLNVAVTREPGLRLRLRRDRPRAAVGAAPAVVIDGKLNEWRGKPTIQLRKPENLAASPHAANHWKGPDDLSAELRLAWSKAGLYFALTVTDDRPTDNENESSLLVLSGSQYRSVSDRTGFDTVLPLDRSTVAAPNERLATVRDGRQTIHEGFIPAAELAPRIRMAPGQKIGVNLIVSDSDDRRTMPYPWCTSNLMAWSNRQDGFDVWADAQACGEVTLGQ
jgi:hypothetical protein